MTFHFIKRLLNAALSRIFFGIMSICLLSSCGKTVHTDKNYKLERGLSVIAFTDSVPLFRKNGVLWKYGALHTSHLNSPLQQGHADFEPYNDTGLVVWTPNEGPLDRISYAYFDAEIPASVDVIPFIATNDTLYLLESEASCVSMLENLKDDGSPKATQRPIENLIATYAEVEPSLFDYMGQKIICKTKTQTADGAWMTPLSLQSSPKAMGFFFKGGKDKTIRLNNFHLGSHDDTNNEFVSVLAEQLVDGSPPSELHVMTNDGQEINFQMGNSELFEIPRSIIDSGPFSAWVLDGDLAVFPSQGQWIDPASLTNMLTIKPTVEFQIDPTDETPRKDKRRRKPHTMSIWSGSTTNMKVQEYEGLNFTNNLGKADRDRVEDNPNGCLRGVFFGGSHVEALQTKIPEKPAIMAEAIMSVKLGQCVEFITYARDLGRAEIYTNDAKNFIKNYGVDFVVFSISSNELCQQNDEYQSFYTGRDISTPLTWRVIDGKLVAPVRYKDAISIPRDKEAAEKAIINCKYINDKLLPIESKPLEKLRDIEAILKEEDNNVEVLFFNFKDILAQNQDVASNINQLCLDLTLQCHTLAVPEHYKHTNEKKRFSPYLYRYKRDGHPNIRANQIISRALSDALIDVYRDKPLPKP